MPSLATISSRFSLGVVLAIFPLLIAYYYGNDSAKTVALAINLSSYSSWLALGGYATVMRDFRLAKSTIEISKLNIVYQHLASFQSLGAVVLTVVIAIIYVQFAQPDYLTQSIFILGLIFGTIVQCSSFWLNLALGISYSKNNFVSVGLSVSILRLMAVLVVVVSSYFSNLPEVVLIASTAIFIFGSIMIYRYYNASVALPINERINNNKQLKALLLESIIYFKWSFLATAVFLLPITAIASISPNLLLPATIAFFLAGANQNLVAALITPQANGLLDGIGDLKVLKSYFYLTAKTTALVTFVMLLSTSLASLFMGKFIDSVSQENFLYMSMVLIIMSGIRALTLAPTQAAITLRKERLVMLSPILEAFASVIGVVVCWLLHKGDWIVGVFVLVVLIRIIVAWFVEAAQIAVHWELKSF